ncbi:MAG: hypothetical protein Kow00107_08400 [Planctomycetota bacterium]
MASIIGIDIGHSNLKIASIRRAGGQFVIESLQSERLGNLSARRGNEFNVQGVAAVIRRIIETARLSPGDVVLGLHGKEVIFKYIEIPPVSEAQIRKLLEFEQAESAKAIQQETVIDYQMLEVMRDAATGLAVVATSRAADLDEDARLMKEAKMPLKGIVPKSLALHKLLVDSNSVNEGETVMMLDIGAESTEIIITRGKGLLMARSANIGGKAFTEAISKTFGVIPEVAEEIKLAEGSIIVTGKRPSRMNEFREGFDELLAAEGVKFRNDPRYPQNLSTALMSAADQIRMACDAAIRFATVQTKIKGINIDRILLSGGGAKLPGLMEYFSMSFRIPCEYWDAISRFNFANVPLEKRDVPTEFANALALAYVASRDTPGVVNLVPEAVKQKRHFWQVQIYAFVGVALVVLGVLIWWMASASKWAATQKLQKEFKEQLDDANRKKNNLRDIEEAITLSALRNEKLAKQTHFNPMVLKFLAALRESLPETIQIGEIRMEPDIDPENKRTNIENWRFVVTGYVSKDVPAQQQSILVEAFSRSIGSLPFVVSTRAETLEAVTKEARSKSGVSPEKGSYKFTFHFVVSENGDLKYDEIRKP